MSLLASRPFMRRRAILSEAAGPRGAEARTGNAEPGDPQADHREQDRSVLTSLLVYSNRQSPSRDSPADDLTFLEW